MTVLIVGDRPSSLNTTDQAFIGARCYPRLLKWLAIMQIDDYRLINASDEYSRYIAECHHYSRVGPIIALGRVAQAHLEGVPHITLPHPSGLNRQNNNPAFIGIQLQMAVDMISQYRYYERVPSKGDC